MWIDEYPCKYLLDFLLIPNILATHIGFEFEMTNSTATHKINCNGVVGNFAILSHRLSDEVNIQFDMFNFGVINWIVRQ